MEVLGVMKDTVLRCILKMCIVCHIEVLPFSLISGAILRDEEMSPGGCQGYLGSPKRPFYSINLPRGTQETQEAPERLPRSRKYRNSLGNVPGRLPGVLG